MTGHYNPITLITDQIVEYFSPYGFDVYYGPEVVSTKENFDTLNIPADHPSRELFDTFYLENGKTLRAHTSALYQRALSENQPPLRLLFPGRVFRNESTDATHNHTFHQIDGLVIDRETNLSNLIASLKGLMKELFGANLEFRIRGSYFPFTEPSIELDIRRPGGDWLEMLGAGMVHPNVLIELGLDPNIFQGYAFGIGLERLISLLTNSHDVRNNLSGDYRYLGQF